METGMLAEIVIHPKFLSTGQLNSMFNSMVDAMDAEGGRSFRVMCHHALLDLVKNKCKSINMECINRATPVRFKDTFTCLRLIPGVMLSKGN